MARKQFSLMQRLLVAMALAPGASGVALADDSSSSRFGGDSYAYFNQPMLTNTAAAAGWRETIPQGLSERDLEALSASYLSASASQLNPSAFASPPADPPRRQPPDWFHGM